MRRSLPLALALCLAGPSTSPDLATAAAQDPGVLVEGIVAVVGGSGPGRAGPSGPPSGYWAAA
jgi:hypothetical protein